MSWFTGKSAEKTRADDTALWREALTSDFARAEQEGLLRHGQYDRMEGQRVDAVFLTRRTVYLRAYSPISESFYGPVTVLPLDRIFAAGPIGAAHATRWALVVAEPEADVERGEQPLAAYAFESGQARAARARSHELVTELRDLVPAGTFRVLYSTTPSPNAPGRLEAALLLSATVDAPDLRSDLERSWEVLDARSRGLPVPERTARSGSSIPRGLTIPPPRPPVAS